MFDNHKEIPGNYCYFMTFIHFTNYVLGPHVLQTSINNIQKFGMSLLLKKLIFLFSKDTLN